ncbi:MAG: carboxymuconolactone decarboxylase family protein [Polyangiaceae bacterium]|jgi:AhpD family alkylhydroperoxidase|nr:carboxymuconolactone decarboxylase family protein [Polyangiaceae bacterium]
MDRTQVYQQVESLFGFVPQFLQIIPDDTLELEWQLMRRVQIDDGVLPNKVRELIGVGIAATTKCAYCIFFHTEMAKLHGATQAEIESAVHYAKSSAGWSTYLNGMQLDQGQFRAEVQRACDYVRASQGRALPRRVPPLPKHHS